MNTGSSQRQQRLAQALRANLRRRKGQARERADDNFPIENGQRDEIALPKHDSASE